MAACFGTMLAEQFQSARDAAADYHDAVERAGDELSKEFSTAMKAGELNTKCRTPGGSKPSRAAVEVFADWACEDIPMGRLFALVSRVAAGVDCKADALRMIDACANAYAEYHAADLVAQLEAEE